MSDKRMPVRVIQKTHLHVHVQSVNTFHNFEDEFCGLK